MIPSISFTNHMRGATMFSGILAPEVAMPFVEWQWCAEIEPFPCSVIKHHRPTLPNLGDVNAADFSERAISHGPIDILVAGSPCQAFSVAGLRKSLGDERGNLALRAVELIHAIRPKYFLWENVPGVLSTSDNAFGCLLAGLVGADTPIHPVADEYSELDGFWIEPPQKWPRAGVVTGPIGTAAWRVLDAQYFGLAQRRERVFLVFCFGDSTSPAEILFEFEGLRRDYPPSREYRQDVTGTPSARTQGGGGLGTEFDLAGGIQAFGGNKGFPDDYTLITHRGKPAADGPRYKALGNSMAVPVLGWIGIRIKEVTKLQDAHKD